MEEQIESDFLTEYALDLFVKHGVLLEVQKDGERAWVENPVFRKLPEEEQQSVFEAIDEENSR